MAVKPRRPFSLVRRIIALVVGVSVVALIMHATLLFYLLPSGIDEQADHIASQIRSVQVALGAVPPADRDRISNAIGGAGFRVARVQPARSPANSPRPDSVPPPFAAKLETVLGPTGTAFMSMDRNKQVWLNVAVPVGAQTWWVSFRTNRPSPLWILLPVLVVATAAVLALVLGVRLITRPMSRLAQDMLARRYELRQIDEPANVSVELQRVIRSFNSLVHAVELSAESRRNLLAGVSHDLRTPLARLRLRVETECADDIAQKMEPDFLALGRIIDQFLAYAQGQSGVAGGRIHPIVDLVEGVVGQYKAEGADVELVRVEDGELGVPDLGVQRALVNLIDNARAYGRGPVEVELASDREEVVVIVYDRGAGIAEHDLAHAFQPFVRLGNATDQAGHCGLGLAIVAQVAEQLGGRTVWKAFDGVRSGVGFALPK